MMWLALAAWASPSEDWERGRTADDPKVAAEWLEKAAHGFATNDQPILHGRVLLDQIRVNPDQAETLWPKVPDLQALKSEVHALKGDLAWARGAADEALRQWTLELTELEPGPRLEQRTRLLAWRHLADRPEDDQRALRAAMSVLKFPSPESLATLLRSDEEVWLVQSFEGVPSWLGFITPHRTRWVRWDGTPVGAFAKLPDSSRVTKRWSLGDPLDLPASVPLEPLDLDTLRARPAEPTPAPSTPRGWWILAVLIGLGALTGVGWWTRRS